MSSLVIHLGIQRENYLRERKGLLIEFIHKIKNMSNSVNFQNCTKASSIWKKLAKLQSETMLIHIIKMKHDKCFGRAIIVFTEAHRKII